MTKFYQAFPRVSTASDKRWGKKAWVRGYSITSCIITHHHTPTCTYTHTTHPLVFHPLCVDEWLQKWNRCCPLCKSAIKRRTHHPSGQEESHLLSDEDLQNEREEETYGATGHSDPIAEASSESLGTAHSDSDHEARNPLSISTVATVEISSEVPPTVESGREDREDPAPTSIPEGSTSVVRV